MFPSGALWSAFLESNLATDKIIDTRICVARHSETVHLLPSY